MDTQLELRFNNMPKKPPSNIPHKITWSQKDFGRGSRAGQRWCDNGGNLNYLYSKIIDLRDADYSEPYIKGFAVKVQKLING